MVFERSIFQFIFPQRGNLHCLNTLLHLHIADEYIFRCTTKMHFTLNTCIIYTLYCIHVLCIHTVYKYSDELKTHSALHTCVDETQMSHCRPPDPPYYCHWYIVLLLLLLLTYIYYYCYWYLVLLLLPLLIYMLLLLHSSTATASSTAATLIYQPCNGDSLYHNNWDSLYQKPQLLQ